jgi:DNA-binding response OmpR family regulator
MTRLSEEETKLNDCVVVVEDDENIRASLALKLEKAGTPVVICHDGESGMEAIELHRPKVLVLDILLPGIDGFEVAKKVREDASLEGAFIIFLTALTSAEDEARGLEAGGDVFLKKPESLAGDELLAIVSSVFEGFLRSVEDPETEERTLHYGRC